MVIFRVFQNIAPLLLISSCSTAPIYPVYQPPTSGLTATVTARTNGYNSPVRIHDDNTCSKETAKLVGYLNVSTVFGSNAGTESTFKVPAGRTLGISIITTLHHTGSSTWCPGLIDFFPEADKHYLVHVTGDRAANRCSYDVYRLDGSDASASRTKISGILRRDCWLDGDF